MAINNSIRECFADKLLNAGDRVGSTLTRAGFTIQKNKKRDTVLTEAATETESVKMLAAAEIFNT